MANWWFLDPWWRKTGKIRPKHHYIWPCRAILSLFWGDFWRFWRTKSRLIVLKMLLDHPWVKKKVWQDLQSRTWGYHAISRDKIGQKTVKKPMLAGRLFDRFLANFVPRNGMIHTCKALSILSDLSFDPRVVQQHFQGDQATFCTPKPSKIASTKA